MRVREREREIERKSERERDYKKVAISYENKSFQV